MNISDPVLRAAVMLRDGDECRYCGIRLDSRDADHAPAIDHVVPRCQGGSDDIGNLALACRSCNSSKGGRTPEEADIKLLAPMGEFDLELMCLLRFKCGLDEKEAMRITNAVGEDRTLDINYMLHECKNEAGRKLVWAITRDASPFLSWVEDVDHAGLHLRVQSRDGRSYEIRHSRKIAGAFIVLEEDRPGFGLLILVDADRKEELRLRSEGALAINLSSSDIQADAYGYWRICLATLNTWNATLDSASRSAFIKRGEAIELYEPHWERILADTEARAEAAE